MSNLITVENEQYQTIGSVSPDSYKETDQAETTSRLLDGSRDSWAYCEYLGRGTIELDGQVKKVNAIYLFGDSDIRDDEGELLEEDNLNFDAALIRFVVLDDQD